MMNNEPIAWMGKDYDGLKTDLYFDAERNKLPYRLYESATPLYTHPVKELTDAITLLEKYADKLEDERPNKGLSDVVLDCVEILRKAQDG
jgi:hypothetical protein